MKFEILTIFPEIIESAVKASLLGKARQAGIIEIESIDIRDFATDKHRTVDDTPFGGGAGMVMKPEPIDRALKKLLSKTGADRTKILLTSASGKKFDQKFAEKLAREEFLIIICGRYKGVDERLKTLYPVEEVSIGDYVLSGGEVAALVITEAVSRLKPGYMGKLEAGEDDSFSWDILGYPVYTQPQVYRDLSVPDVLVSGHHENIRKFRRKEALRKTLLQRPEILEKVALNAEDEKLLDEIKQEENNF